MCPSSIVTGMATVTAFLQFERTLTRSSSMLNARATLRSCSWAISKGFSRRCETDASTAVTITLLVDELRGRVFCPSADSEPDRSHRRLSAAGWPGEDPQAVGTVLQHSSLWSTTGQSDGVAAG